MTEQQPKTNAARIRINAVLLALVAVLVYGGFIFLSWYRGH